MDEHHLRRLLADALRESARQLELGGMPAPRAPVSHRGPLNPAHQSWRGFVEDMQKLEAEAKREGLKLTKANLCRLGVDTVRTITRTMAWYGVTSWPPSTWDPEKPPAGAKNS
jgi:hypothetical protein